MKINAQKLIEELIAVGIEIGGCNTSGEVWTADGTRIQDREDVAEVLAAHEPTELPTPTLEERLAGLESATLELLLGGG